MGVCFSKREFQNDHLGMGVGKASMPNLPPELDLLAASSQFSSLVMENPRASADIGEMGMLRLLFHKKYCKSFRQEGGGCKSGGKAKKNGEELCFCSTLSGSLLKGLNGMPGLQTVARAGGDFDCRDEHSHPELPVFGRRNHESKWAPEICAEDEPKAPKNGMDQAKLSKNCPDQAQSDPAKNPNRRSRRDPLWQSAGEDFFSDFDEREEPRSEAQSVGRRSSVSLYDPTPEEIGVFKAEEYFKDEADCKEHGRDRDASTPFGSKKGNKTPVAMADGGAGSFWPSCMGPNAVEIDQDLPRESCSAASVQTDGSRRSSNASAPSKKSHKTENLSIAKIMKVLTFEAKQKKASKKYVRGQDGKPNLSRSKSAGASPVIPKLKTLDNASSQANPTHSGKAVSAGQHLLAIENCVKNKSSAPFVPTIKEGFSYVEDGPLVLPGAAVSASSANFFGSANLGHKSSYPASPNLKAEDPNHKFAAAAQTSASSAFGSGDLGLKSPFAVSPSLKKQDMNPNFAAAAQVQVSSGNAFGSVDFGHKSSYSAAPNLKKEDTNSNFAAATPFDEDCDSDSSSDLFELDSVTTNFSSARSSLSRMSSARSSSRRDPFGDQDEGFNPENRAQNRSLTENLQQDRSAQEFSVQNSMESRGIKRPALMKRYRISSSSDMNENWGSGSKIEDENRPPIYANRRLRPVPDPSSRGGRVGVSQNRRNWKNSDKEHALQQLGGMVVVQN